ncbi:50S ribosomal protein L27, chloroplastic, partial [Tanacetum coccineum]
MQGKKQESRAQRLQISVGMAEKSAPAYEQGWLLFEPTTTALSYGLNNKEGIIIVFDLGGDAFDASGLAISNGNSEVLISAKQKPIAIQMLQTAYCILKSIKPMRPKNMQSQFSNITHATSFTLFPSRMLLVAFWESLIGLDDNLKGCLRDVELLYWPYHMSGLIQVSIRLNRLNKNATYFGHRKMVLMDHFILGPLHYNIGILKLSFRRIRIAYQGKQPLLALHGPDVQPGKNVGIGKDYTIFTLIDGLLEFEKFGPHRKK